MDALLQDIRHAFRALKRTPGFTAIAIGTLALAIGANAAIFSVFNSVLLRRLEYTNPDRLVRLREANPSRGFSGVNITGPEYVAWQQQQRSFSELAAYIPQNAVVNGLGEPIELVIGVSGPDFFRVLGEQPILGRTFSRDEHLQNGPPAVLISRGFWLRQYGGDSSVLGKTVILNDIARPIIGVMPDAGELTSDIEMWAALPVDVLPQLPAGAHMLTVIGRLKDGMTLESATADLAAITKRYLATLDESARGWRPETQFLASSLVSPTNRTTVITLFGAVGFVLLIACANLANLTLVRAQTRRREVVLRAALGANRWRVVRALVTESALLAVVGSGLGVLVGVWGIDAIRSLAPESLNLDGAALDTTVLLFMLAVTVGATILFGVVPAITSSRADLQTALREADTRVMRRGFSRDVLAVIEIALALVLTAGAGLLVQSLKKLHQQSLGYDPAGVLALDLDLPARRFATPESRLQFVQRVEEQVRAIPGVVSVGSTRALPLESGGSDTQFEIEGQPSSASAPPWSFYTPSSADYLRTMKATLVRGRLLENADVREGAAAVAVINEAFARRYLANQNPLGTRLKLGPNSVEIVGVVRDLRQRFLRDSIQPQMFVPFSYEPTLSVSMVVRAQGNPLDMIPALHAAVWAVDPKLPVEEWTMQSLMQTATAESRFSMSLIGAFAGLAILLAVIGVYGVVSFGVAQRAREIGVRMALGAQRHRVLQMVLNRGLFIAALGVAAGTAGTVALGRAFSGLLFGVQSTDPLTLLLSAAVVGLIVLVACAFPARRAAAVDPLVALRSD